MNQWYFIFFQQFDQTIVRYSEWCYSIYKHFHLLWLQFNLWSFSIDPLWSFIRLIIDLIKTVIIIIIIKWLIGTIAINLSAIELTKELPFIQLIKGLPFIQLIIVIVAIITDIDIQHISIAPSPFHHLTLSLSQPQYQPTV